MPWTLIIDPFYTVWAEDDFFYVPAESDWAFYLVEETIWAEDDYFYIPDSFYWDGNLFYFDPTRWLLPLDNDFDYVKSTANYEELAVLPEDLDIVPDQVQFRRTEWERNEDLDESDSWSIRKT